MRKLIVVDMNHRLGREICAGAGLEPNMVRRIVLDLKVGEAGIAYVESFIDADVLEVSASALGIEIRSEEQPEPAGEPQRVGIEPAEETADAAPDPGDEDNGEAAV